MQGYFPTTGNEQLVELSDFPQQSSGAPLPLVLADDGTVVLSYLMMPSDESFEHLAVRDDDGNLIGFSEAEEVDEDAPAQIAFVLLSSWLHLMGGPNNEALNGHPLYKLGLQSYGVYEVVGSCLPSVMERMNSVHPSHKPERFEGLRHLISTFHGGLFECVTTKYLIFVEIMAPSARVGRMGQLLERAFDILYKRGD